ncbi:MAG: glycosyltransferase [Chthoniobacterales bacterium]
MTTTKEAWRDFRLTVLNPGGRDPAQDFSLGCNRPDDREHAPVNFHAYAACTGGSFEREVSRAVAARRPVLLLLRGDFKETQQALLKLQKEKLPVVLSFKETGLHQIARQLADPKRAARFHEIIQAADGCLAATADSLAFYGRGKFIPTPYPIDDPRWDFSRSLGERRGVFVGTREWDTPSRNHLAALVLAAALGEAITVFDEEPKRCRKILGALGVPGDSLRVLEDRLSYRDYLAEVARHRVVLQADTSSVPGQVAGDALLCRLPCVGGDGAVEQIAFPETSGHGRSLGELAELAARLLRDSDFYNDIVAQSQTLARGRLGFDIVARELEEFFAEL